MVVGGGCAFIGAQVGFVQLVLFTRRSITKAMATREHGKYP